MAKQSIVEHLMDRPFLCAAVVLAVLGTLYAASRPSAQPEVPESAPPSLSAQVQSWSCPTPAGAEGFTPLVNIPVQDEARLLEARARIELARRRINSQWDTAAGYFAMNEQQFAFAYHYLGEYKRRAQLSLGNEPQLAAERVQSIGRQYSLDCTTVTTKLSSLVADDAKLRALLAEPGGKWRRGRLPCAVSRTAQCRP